MFNHLSGAVTAIHEKSITLTVSGIGFAVYTPYPKKFILDTPTALHTYFHWNTENGPSIYGFCSELERKTFLLIIDCPKIGPSIALNILAQITASQFLDIVMSNNSAGLSTVHGIGSKKAEQIILELKNKIQKMLTCGDLIVEQQQNFVQWQELSEVLASLNYTKPEIAHVTQHLAKKYTDHNHPLDQLIRAALSYLSQKQA